MFPFKLVHGNTERLLMILIMATSCAKLPPETSAHSYPFFEEKMIIAVSSVCSPAF